MYRAALALISGSFLGKLLGVVRELILAALFGTTALVDAYRAALSATLIPTDFFTADTLNAVFIPLYTRYQQKNKEIAQSLFWVIFILFTIISILITTFLILTARLWVRWLVPGFTTEILELTVNFVSVMALGVPFYIQAALFAYLEMGNGRFVLASLRASMQSIGLIIGTVLAFWMHKPVFLAWGFTGSYILFSILGMSLLRKWGYLHWPFNWRTWNLKPILYDFWLLIRPLLLLPVIFQGNVALERIVASLIGTGVIASHEYVKTITDTGIVLVAAPLGLAGLSQLSRVTDVKMREHLDKLVPFLLLVFFPISLFIALKSEAIIRLLYARGAFDETSVFLTSQILFGSSFGFWAGMIGYVLIKALNAHLRNKEVMLVMGISLTLKAIINISLYRFLGPVTLGISYSVYGITMFILTIRAFKLGKVVNGYFGFLILGGILSVMLSLFTPGEGFVGLTFQTGLFFIVWFSFILAIPKLRNTVASLMRSG